MGGLVTFVMDEDDLALVEATSPQALRGTIVAFDPDVADRLHGAGIPHVTPWDFVHQEHLPGLERSEREIWKFWQEQAHARFMDVDLLQLLPYRHRACLARFAWAACAARRVLETLRPREVIAFHEPVGHGLDQPEDGNKMPLLSAIVRGLAVEMDIAVRVLDRAAVPGQAGFVDLVNRRGERRLPPVDPEQALGGRPYVLFAGSGIDMARQRVVVDRLRRDSGLEPVVLYKSGDESLLAALAGEGVAVFHESQFHGEGGDATDLGTAARRDFDRACREAPGSVRCIFDNPHMETHFGFIFGEYLTKMARHVATWTALFRAHPPAAAVTLHQNAVFEVAAHAGVPCLALSHAPMLVGNARWFATYPPCTIGAISETHRDRLTAAGLAPDRVTVAGDLRIDRLRHESARAGRDREPGRREILLLTGNLSSPARTDGLPRCDWSDALRCIAALPQLVRKHPGVRWTIKCHPRFDHPAIYERLSQAVSAGQVRIAGDEPIERLAPAADVIVTFNALTSATIEASFFERPVLVFCASMVRYDRREWGLERWAHVESLAALDREIAALFADPRHYRRSVDRTRAALEALLRGAPADCAARCVDVIEALCAREAACR